MHDSRDWSRIDHVTSELRPPPVPPPAGPACGSTRGNGMMCTILCIDDEPAVSATLESSLRGMGHRPVVASTLDEGIRAVGRETFDLIISDHQMPDGSGIDLLAALKRNGQDI